MLFARSSALPKMLPILGAVLISSTLLAADDLHDLFTQGPTPLQRELKPISERIQAKILAGAHDRKLFTNELNAIEEVLRRYPAERPEKLAEVRYGLAIGHWKLFNDPTRAIQLLEQLKRDFPQTTYAPKAASDIEAIPKIDAGIRMRASIALGTPFPDFEVRDMSDQPLSTTSCRGKPVLILSWKVSTAPYLQFDRLLALQRKY